MEILLLIHSKEIQNDVKNYGPISPLQIYSKTCEGITRVLLPFFLYLIKNNLFPQSEFTQGDSYDRTFLSCHVHG